MGRNEEEPKEEYERRLKDMTAVMSMDFCATLNRALKQERAKVLDEVFKELYIDEEVTPTLKTKWVNQKLLEIKRKQLEGKG